MSQLPFVGNLLNSQDCVAPDYNLSRQGAYPLTYDERSREISQYHREAGLPNHALFTLPCGLLKAPLSLYVVYSSPPQIEI